MGEMLRGKVAVVTGAGRGIGRGVALALADQVRRWWSTTTASAWTAASRTASPPTPWSRRSERPAAKRWPAPIRSPSGTARRASSPGATDTFGRLDILVTCAGFLRDRMIFNMSEEEFDSVVGVHLKGTFNCIRHAAPIMREQRTGRIITFSSGSGLFGNPGQANYGSAKAAISGLTKVVARDLGKYGVTANGICPVAATRMTLTPEVLKAREIRRQQGIIREESALRQLENLQPEDVGPMVVFLASDFAAGINGQFFLCAGTSYSLLSLPRAEKTLYKEGRWTLDELDALVRVTLAEGLVNPAPPKQA